MRSEIIVVGAGVSGLATALLLNEAGLTVTIVEAGEIPGGRIRSVTNPTSNAFVADLGPTWIWPAYQPTISRWVEKLDLQTFEQFTDGDAVLDFGPEAPPEIRFLPSQDGSVRLQGGSQAIIDRLISRFPEDGLRLKAHVSSIAINENGVRISTDDASQSKMRADRVIIAVPPRIAANRIDWQPGLDANLAQALEDTPTWMAPHAKVAVIYDTPFWRERGLSGRIASQAGPLVEAHDHAGPDGAPAALFGFVGWPHEVRASLGPELEQHVIAQLKRCFGADSPDPIAVHIEDWAMDAKITSSRDLSGPMNHPDVRPQILREPHFAGRLIFAGAETALRSPGLIEGAFDAAERSVDAVLA